MKIDKNKLIDLLVEKTDMGRDEIKDQLDKLIERILDAAKRGKALEIKEFGLFYFDEEGELSFDPAEELSTEISFKYAGMKPVELKPERDTTIYEPEEPEEEPEEDEATTETDETEDDDPFGIWEDEEEQEAEASKPITEAKEDESIDDSLYDPFAPEAMEPLEEPVEPEEDEPKTKIEDIKPVSPRQPIKKRRDYTGVFILAAIILIAALIGAYFYYTGSQTQELDERAEPTAQTDPNMGQEEETGTEDPLPSETENENGEETTQDQQLTDETDPTAEQTGSDQVSEEEFVSEPEVAIAETNQSMYGLRGSVVAEASNGYSIVLHSFTSEERAMTAADRLREEGYRVIVTSRTVYENMVWRVSVGQFQTLTDAQQATTQLPSPYNTQNFIQRIRTN